jgi:hypothetical protein
VTYAIEVGGYADFTNLTWSIAGNSQGQSPNILSELKFRSIKTVGAFSTGIIQPTKYLKVSIGYRRSSVFDGHGTDTDYKDDNRLNPTYDKPFESNTGYSNAFEVGLIWQALKLRKSTFGVSITYDSNNQQFSILNQDFKNLNSTYAVNWKGVKAGPVVTIALNKRLGLMLAGQYYLIDYKSIANWNLIEIFRHPVSFVQDAEGNGMDGAIGLGYKLSALISLRIDGRISYVNVDKGVDRSFLRNGNEILTQFNGASIFDIGLQTGISFKF